MTDYTEADAAAEYVRSSGQKPMGMFFPSVDECDTLLAHAYKIAPAYQQLRTENARLAADLAAARAERDAARQAAADWRLLAECCALRGVMQFLTAMRHIKEVAPGHDGLRFTLAFLAADSYRDDLTQSLVDAARRLAAPHLDPTAEGGAK